MRSSVQYALAAAVTLSLGVVCAYAAQAQRAPDRTQAPGGNKPSSPASGMSVRTYVDKTALWVGDQFHYQIFVDHSPDIQFILENVNAETITLDPLRVVDVEFSTVPLKNGNERLFMDLTLAHLTPGLMQVKIPQLTLFYFRREGAAAPATSEGAAAEGFTIEGPVISARSTLPPGQSDLRDAVTVTGWPRSRWIAAGIGWCALVLLVGGVAWESARLIRRRGRQGPDPRKAMAAIRDRWSESVPADFNDTDAVMAFYGRSYRDLKEYLGYLLETHTEGLTADELRAEMTRRAADPDLIDRTVRVAEVCENARYAPIGTAAVSGTAAEAVADNMREIFKAGLR
jgi:hypothetical protein